MLKSTLWQIREQAKLRRHDVRMLMKIEKNHKYEKALKHLEIRLGGLVHMAEMIEKYIDNVDSITEEK